MRKLLFTLIAGLCFHVTVYGTTDYINILQPQNGDSLYPGQNITITVRSNLPGLINLEMGYLGPDLPCSPGACPMPHDHFQRVCWWSDLEMGDADSLSMSIKVPLFNSSYSPLRLKAWVRSGPISFEKDSVDLIYIHPNPDLNEPNDCEEIATYVEMDSEPLAGLLVGMAGYNRITDGDHFFAPAIPGVRYTVNLQFSPFFRPDTVSRNHPWLSIAFSDENRRPIRNQPRVDPILAKNGLMVISQIAPVGAAYCEFDVSGGYGIPGGYYTIRVRQQVPTVTSPRPISDEPDPDGLFDIEPAENFGTESSEAQVALMNSHTAGIGNSFWIRPLQSSGRMAFEVSLDEAGSFALAIHDVLGRTIARHFTPSTTAGIHRVNLLPSGNSKCRSGVYFVVLEGSGKRITRSFAGAR